MPATPIDQALATLQAAINRYGTAVKTDSNSQNSLISALNNLTGTIQSTFNAHTSAAQPHGATVLGMTLLKVADAAAARTAIGAVSASDNVAGAAKLTTARKINGVDFDGSKDITVTAIDQAARDAAAAAQSAANTASTLAGSKLDAGANAVSASKLATARKINGVNFDGTADITVTAVDQTARNAAATAQSAADTAQAAANAAQASFNRMTFEY